MFKFFTLCLLAVFAIAAAKPGYVATYASSPLLAASPYEAYASPYYTTSYAASPYVASPYVASPYAVSPYAASPYVAAASPYVSAAYSGYSPYSSLLLRR